MMTSLVLEAASWFAHCSHFHRCHFMSSAAATHSRMEAATVGWGLAAWKLAVCGITGVAGPRGGGREKAGRKGEAARRMIPGAAVAEVSGTFSGQRRIKAAAATKATQSLYAEELAACDTSSQVLQLLNTSPSLSREWPKPQTRLRQQGRLTSRESVALPYLLPVDCLAFLNALLRVQQLRRSGAEFLYFCEALEDTLQRYNARWVEAPSAGLPQRWANLPLKLDVQERDDLLQEIQGAKLYGDVEVGGTPVSAASLHCRPPPHAGRFIRLVLQKLSDLKAPLAFNQMVPYLTPHVPTLAPFDVAECLWSFAVLQPPEWRVKHTFLLTQLLQRLLHPKSSKSEGRTEASDCASGTQDDVGNGNSSSGRNEVDSASGGGVAGGEEGTAPAVVAGTAEQTSKDADWRSLPKTRKQRTLHQALEWVAESPGERRRQCRSNEGTKDPLLLLDDLSNLMIYRVVFGVAKLDLRCRIAQEVYLALAPRIVRRLAEREVEAFPPVYLVRMAWAYARLRVRHVPLYESTCRVLREVLEDLSYKELKVVKHVYEALEFNDRAFLGAVDLLLHQMRELNAAGEDLGESPHRAARVKPFKTRPKRVGPPHPCANDVSYKMRFISVKKARRSKLTIKTRYDDWLRAFTQILSSPDSLALCPPLSCPDGSCTVKRTRQQRLIKVTCRRVNAEFPRVGHFCSVVRQLGTDGEHRSNILAAVNEQLKAHTWMCVPRRAAYVQN